MWIVNLYFYIGCYWRWGTSSVGNGAFFHLYPTLFIVTIMDHVYNKLTFQHMSVLFGMIMTLSMIFLVYLYYKRHRKGEKIIEYYDNNYPKLRKWYIIFLIWIAYLCAFYLITYCSFKIIDCIL